MARLRSSVVWLLSGLCTALVLPVALPNVELSLHFAVLASVLAVMPFVVRRPVSLWHATPLVAVAFAGPLLITDVAGTAASRVLEAGLLVWLVVAGSFVSRRFEVATAHVQALDGGTCDGPIEWEDASPIISREMKRARRSEAPLTVIVVAQSARPPQASMRDLARLIHGGLRDTDTVILRHHPAETIVLSPATSSQQAAALTDRILEIAGGFSARAVFASFPEDGYAFDAVVERARERLQHTATTSPPRPVRVVGDVAQ